jgi:UDP-N-acetylglucosamine acyltransferase
MLMAYSHVAHDCIIGNNVIIVNSVLLGGEVIVDDFAILGGGSAIHQFVHIGAHVMLQGGALVGKDIPPYVKAARFPISFAGINSIGLRRRQFTNDKISEIQEIYRMLYLRGMNVSQAIEFIEAEMPASPERDEILLFIKNSRRGIIKGYNSGKEMI